MWLDKCPCSWGQNYTLVLTTNGSGELIKNQCKVDVVGSGCKLSTPKRMLIFMVIILCTFIIWLDMEARKVDIKTYPQVYFISRCVAVQNQLRRHACQLDLEGLIFPILPESVNSFLPRNHLSVSCCGSRRQIAPAGQSQLQWLPQVKVTQVKRTHVEFSPAAAGKMILWEVWRTPERKPCCDQYIAGHQSFLLGPHRYEDLHRCTVAVSVVPQQDRTQAWLSLIVFRCSASSLERVRGQSTGWAQKWKKTEESVIT